MQKIGYKCKYIDGGINFFYSGLLHCCQSSHKGGGCLPICETYNGEPINWDEVFSMKEKLSNDLLKGIIPDKCEGCLMLQEVTDPVELEAPYRKKLNLIEVSHFNRCNAVCIYCCVRPDNPINNSPLIDEYDVYPVFADMLEKNLFEAGGHIIFAGGEPTILKDFDKIVAMFYDRGFGGFIVHSSGIKYSETVPLGLAKERDNFIIISVDAGTRETYEKIKGVDCFDKVCSNIKKYIDNSKTKSHVRTKYIIVPKVNDSMKEINRWYDIMVKDLGCESIILDVEQAWYKAHSNNKIAWLPIIRLIKHIQKRGKEDGVRVEFYEQASLMKSKLENERRIENWFLRF